MKINHAHEIQQLFRYQYKDQWMNAAFINSHSRLWIQAFNDLVKQEFIQRKKTQQGYVYRWIAKFPDI